MTKANSQITLRDECVTRQRLEEKKRIFHFDNWENVLGSIYFHISHSHFSAQLRILTKVLSTQSSGSISFVASQFGLAKRRGFCRFLPIKQMKKNRNNYHFFFSDNFFIMNQIPQPTGSYLISFYSHFHNITHLFCCPLPMGCFF